ncbi:unnamed protein product [Linum tenue]|uniref:Uncharacterized protein n=2 Tax=Linum TaxID=4005 RepID=A0AAV0PJP2_9ROSI|nr:unnamed protein product [Linum tenue]CAI0472351.1 unnamed protein product [Linum tenue]
MAGERKRILVGLIVAMLLGTAVYFRLWTIDYAISSEDTELIRRQFDLANREAMDESAEWRMKYDEEAERAAKCDKELIEIKQKVDDAASVNQQLAVLQKENMALIERMELLKKELAASKSKCGRSRYTRL